MIRPVTFDKQFIRAEDDAHSNNVAVGGDVGRSRGCKITFASNTITISDGYFYIYGRLLRVEGDTTFSIDSITHGRYYCSLVYTMDLKRTNTEDDFLQGRIELIKKEENYPILVQEDLDNGGEVYQLELARFIQLPAGVEMFEDVLKNIMTIDEVYGSIFLETQASADKLGFPLRTTVYTTSGVSPVDGVGKRGFIIANNNGDMSFGTQLYSDERGVWCRGKYAGSWGAWSKVVAEQGTNVFTGQQIMKGSVGVNANSWSDSRLLIQAPYNENSNVRAGLAFDNAGHNAAYLYFDVTGRLRMIDNAGSLFEIQMTKLN